MLQENPAGAALNGDVPEESRLPDPRSRRIFRFGGFEFRTETGELSKHGIRVRVQAKPIQVLETLLTKPGQLVTREELFKKLWPEGTFVDFENGLNTATNRLRAALCDSAEAPRYIETLPRLGYRFICPVVETEEHPSTPILSDVGPPLATPAANLPAAPERSLPSPTSKPRALEATSPSRGSSAWHKVSQIAALVVLALIVLGLEYFRGRTLGTRRQPIFRQLTFHTGIVGSARFAPDKKVIYTAKWEGGDRQTYLMDLNSSKFQALGFASGALASVSRKGELAVFCRNPVPLNHPVRLSRVSLNGGSSQVVAEGIKAADWAPNGRELAIVREVGPESVVEFPVGNVIYSSHGWINGLRVSPSGAQVAFLEHPVRDDDAGHVRVADTKGNARLLTDEWSSADGLAWSPSGKEVWFTASKNGAARVLYAVSETAKLRQISNTPSDVRLLDISGKGRVLIAVDDTRMALRGVPGAKAAESDLSKFDFSHVDDISSDGNLVLFTEAGDAGGQHYETYVYNQRSRATFHIAPGRGLAISPDAQWVLTIDPQDRNNLTLSSINSQPSKKVLGNGFEYQWAKFLPDGKRLIVGGAFPGEHLAICTQLLDSGNPVPLNGVPYMDFVAVSPNGFRIAGATASDTGIVFDLTNNSARQISPSMNAFPVAWSLDNQNLFAVDHRDSVYRIVKTNPQTGKTELWKTLPLGDQAGIIGLAGIVMAPANGAYAYSISSNLSRLYLVDNWS
jgi:eukaryotic-like serine/threonine-protein kinase